MTFAAIAERTKLPEMEVELLLMKSLSLNLVKGVISGVDSTVSDVCVRVFVSYAYSASASISVASVLHLSLCMRASVSLAELMMERLSHTCIYMGVPKPCYLA